MRISSKEVFTVANGMSATGGLLAVHGAPRIDTFWGLCEVIAARILDLGDGPYARKTRTDSEFGATVDATIDKVASFAIVFSEWKKDIAPKPVLAAIVAQNGVNAAATAVAKARHPEADLSPTRDGKNALFIQNVALGSYAIANLLEDGSRGDTAFRFFGLASAAVGVGYYGVKATVAYIKRAAD
ncbi:MAG: CDP-alcohol phosphatidyltransferase family protein [Candidatus Saccharimonadales bacterium]